MSAPAWSDFALATPAQGQAAPQSGGGSGWDQFALATSPQGQTQQSVALSPTPSIMQDVDPRAASAPAPSENPVTPQPPGQSLGQQVQQGASEYWNDLSAPAVSAWESLGKDVSAPIGTHNGLKTAGDVGALLASPITGLLNAEVVQPGAALLDQIPGAARIGLDANGKVQATPLTLAERHAQNEQIINTALMGLGPEGMEGGSAAKFATAKNASNLASVVTKVPADVALDASGKLTDEGLEYAAKANVRPKDLETAYKAVQDAKAPTPEATTEQPASAPEAAARQAAPEQAAPAATSGSEATPQPTQGASAAEGGVRVGPNGLTEFGERPQDVPTTPAGRAAEAQGLGVNLTEGEATRDFSTQDAEERLRAGEAPQSNAARQFRTQQQDSIANAVDTLKQAIGDPTMTAEDRGQMVQDALRQMNQSGQAGASAVYDQARQLADALGEHGSNLMKLDTGDLTSAIKNILVDETVDPQARTALRQQAAQYGLIGGDPRLFEDGTASVRVRDQEGNDGPSITLPRPPEPLTIQNAEGLRQAANRIYRQFDEPRALELKGALDKAVGDAIDRAATSDAGEFGKTMQKARAIYRENRETFGAKDVVNQLIDWKVEGKTPTIAPDRAIAKLLQGGKDSITALKKVKAVLLSKPTEQSRAAWQAIKSQALDNIFSQARVVNANGGAGALSGAKLNSAIQKFGVEKLKTILNENEFNQLMQLRRVVANATIPADHIVNSSNSGNLLARFAMKHGNSVVGKALRSVPGIGHGLEAARDAAEIAKQHAEDARTLNGILNYKPTPGS